MAGLLDCSPIFLPVLGNGHRCVDGIQHALLVCPALSRLAVGGAMVNGGAYHRQADGTVDAAHGGVLLGDGVHGKAAEFQGDMPLIVVHGNHDIRFAPMLLTKTVSGGTGPVTS